MSRNPALERAEAQTYAELTDDERGFPLHFYISCPKCCSDAVTLGIHSSGGSEWIQLMCTDCRFVEKVEN